MSVAVNLQNLSAPSENWDDDFDFHSQSGSPRRPNDTYGRPPTMRMSTATEDWDVDGPVASSSMHYDFARPTNISANGLNTTLTDCVEDGPSTPQKVSRSGGFSTENWDDDFLDKTESPIRRSPRATHAHSRSSINGKLRTGVPLHHRKPLRQFEEEEHESWDDEFNLRSSPTKPGESSTPRGSQNAPIRHPAYPLPSRHDQCISDDDDDDDADFGSANAEEDRTVTARSRRAPQQHTPPPPVPSIPFTLTSTITPPLTTATTYMHLSAPFPRSPTASVFSVPASSVADTTSLRSTAPLRPSLTRTSANNALKHLPPSPPIHRERRRLRKKSRPQQEGVFELVDLNSHYPLSDAEFEQRLEEVDERRTPSPSPIAPGPIAMTVQSTPSQSTGSGGAILTRMGSLKNRWTGRKKKASLTPSEVSKHERRKDLPDNTNEHPTPRPRSSLSSLLHSTPTIPPPSSSWFFRPSSPAYPRHRNSVGKGSNPRSSYTGSRSGSMTDLSTRGSTASSSNFGDDDDSLSHKLPKRKSLGFVQFQNGFLSNGLPSKGKMRDDESDSDGLKRSTSKRPMSLQTPSPSTFRPPPSLRHTSYTTPEVKELAANTDLHEGGVTNVRERKQSTPKATRLRPRDQAKGRGKERERDEGKENEQEEGEGSRGFMRRLSFVGRHRRTKSGASMSNVEAMERVPSESLAIVPPDIPPADKPPSLPPLPPFSEIHMPRPPSPPGSPASSLLPPIELQPPSPPRNFEIPIKTDTTDANHSLSTYLSPTAPSLARDAIISTPAPASISSTSFAHAVKPLESAKCSKTAKNIPSGYTASLGRASISPKTSLIADGAQRRNSLSDLKSDLKIPARISQAQQGLKRDLGMVRDFAVYIDQLKKQQEKYNNLLLQMQQKLDTQAQLAQQSISRAVSPSFFNLTKPKTRARSNTNPSTPGARYKELAAALYAINSRYRISWECAELLVELADGTTSTDGAPPPTSTSAPVVLGIGGEKRGRERAITLGGEDTSKPSTPTQGMSSSMVVSSSTPSYPDPPPVSPPAWRASAGRHDLSHRQLVLLREMLNNAEAVLSSIDGSGLPLTVPEETTPSSTTDSLRVNRDWRWGHPMSSTVTLPSEDINGEKSRKKKHRVSKLVGMAGLRDVLRALKKNVTDSALNYHLTSSPRLSTEHNHPVDSMRSLATDVSSDLPNPKDPVQGRRPTLSSGPEATVKKERGRDPTPPSIEIPAPSKPRRPSLASIFRIGSRKNTPPSMLVTDLPTQYSDRESSRPGTGQGSHRQNGLEEDWDKIDSASDLDGALKPLPIRERDGASISKKSKGKSPYLQYRAPSSSTSQLVRPCTPRRSASGSQLAILAESPSKVRTRTPNLVTPRAPRLSNVDEIAEGTRPEEVKRQLRRTSSRTSGRVQKSGSIRSMPSQPILSESRLAMTPENIKPLLENAKEVHARLVDCILEIQQLLESDGAEEFSVSGSSCASATGQSTLS